MSDELEEVMDDLEIASDVSGSFFYERNGDKIAVYEVDGSGKDPRDHEPIGYLTFEKKGK